MFEDEMEVSATVGDTEEQAEDSLVDTEEDNEEDNGGEDDDYGDVNGILFLTFSYLKISLESTSKKGRKKKGKKKRGKVKKSKDSLSDLCTSTSDDVCISLGVVNVNFEYTDEEFDTITTAKVNLFWF